MCTILSRAGTFVVRKPSSSAGATIGTLGGVSP